MAAVPPAYGAPPAAGGEWKDALDPATGQTFYYHTVTKETRWDRPPEMGPQAPSPYGAPLPGGNQNPQQQAMDLYAQLQQQQQMLAAYAAQQQQASMAYASYAQGVSAQQPAPSLERASHPNHKTKLCTHWMAKGSCGTGDRYVLTPRRRVPKIHLAAGVDSLTESMISGSPGATGLS